MNAPTACYFPFTDIKPLSLGRALLFFKTIILYSLPDGHPDEYLAAAADRDRLRLVEADFIRDRNEIKKVLAELGRWAELHGDPLRLSSLKYQLSAPEFETSPSGLMTAIRGRRADPAAREDPDREAQIFLHLAQHFDRQKSEVNALLAEVEKRSDLLGRIMGVEEAALEENGSEFGGTPGGPPLSPPDEPGGELMPLRLAAWARLHAAYGQPGQALFTDSPEAVAQLDLNLARAYPGHYRLLEGATDVLEEFLKISLEAPADLIPLEEIESRRPFPPEFIEFLARAAGKPWTKEELAALREEAQALTAAAEARLSPNQKSPAMTLTGYLLPGLDLKEAFLAAAGVGPRPGDSTVYCGPIWALNISTE